MISALQGEFYERSKPQFWHYPTTKPSLAMRKGDWKLLTNLDGSNAQLYDLANDSAESGNLAKENPNQVNTMRQSLLDWYGELPVAKKQP